MTQPTFLRGNLLAFCAFLVADGSTIGFAQCLDWSRSFGLPGIGAPASWSNVQDVRDLAVHDDGSGPKLYLAGYFDSAGDVACSGVVRWNGTAFEPVGGGFQYSVFRLASLDDGSGLALYANHTVGGPASTYRWDGSTWTPMPGISGLTTDYVVFDDGTGPALYASPDRNEPTPGVNHGWVYRWNGSTWSLVGGGLNYYVDALEVYDDGTGPALYAGGDFNHAGATTWTRGIARWDGTSWTEVGGGLYDANGYSASCSDLAVWDDGTGAKLYVAGAFERAGTQSIRGLASWDGTQWSAVGGGIDGYPWIVERVDLASGSFLAVGGVFAHAGGAPVASPALFDGTTWRSLSSGFVSGAAWFADFATYDRGQGPELIAAGSFETAGGVPAIDVARFDGLRWNALVSGDGVTGTIRALANHDDGSGRALYAGGDLRTAGDQVVRLVARWDGSSWSRVGTQAVDAGETRALASVDFGAGSRLVAGGTFAAIDGVPSPGIAAWDGSAWASLPGGGASGGAVNALHARREGGSDVLYAAGSFATIGGVATGPVARFDGSAWSSLGAPAGSASAISFFDDGTGEKLHVARGNQVHVLNGTAWSVIPNGPNGSQSRIDALCAFDDGVTRSLFVGGLFSHVGSTASMNIARWDGSAWHTFGPGASGYSLGFVGTFRVFDDGLGGGPKLFAGGHFSFIGSTIGYSVLSWDGTSWQPAAPGGGVDAKVYALEPFDDGEGAALHAGGSFHVTNLGPAEGIARYGRHGLSGCEPVTGTPYCAGDGSASACPCGNAGLAGAGCDNSGGTGGASLSARGQASLAGDTVTLDVAGTSATSPLLFFQGTTSIAGGAGAPFGDGLRCVGGTQIRLAIRAAVGGVASFGAGVPGDPLVSEAGAIHGPTTRFHQVWYRDAAPAYCTSATFNLSNGLRIRWGS